jgi:hypothetical protein
MRGLALAPMLAAMVAAAAGCSSSSSSPNPSASYSQSYTAQQQRQQQLEPLLVGCFASHGLIPAKDLQNQSWYQNGHVTVNNEFTLWWHNFEGLPVKLNGTYQHLDDVVRSAANGNWPASICGPEPSASPTGS